DQLPQSSNAAPSVPPAPKGAAPTTSILVPGGTSVSVSLTEAISSGSANVGDHIPIIVTKEVDLNGMVVVPKGANGQATVAQVERSGSNGHGGKLALTMDWIFSADGGKVQLSDVNHANTGDGDTKGAASTATILTWALLGPVGLFAHNFVHGKDVTVDTSRVFTAFVDHDVHVQASQKAAAPDGFDK
ncbi:MAG: hypothetical protein ACXWNZ_18680, partial [Vulcanimicrobiaceae bacterium]